MAITIIPEELEAAVGLQHCRVVVSTGDLRHYCNQKLLLSLLSRHILLRDCFLGAVLLAGVLLGLRLRAYLWDWHVFEVLSELLLDGQPLHVRGASSLQVIDRMDCGLLVERLQLDFDDHGRSVRLVLQLQVEVEDDCGRDMVESALEPHHAEAGQLLVELQQQLQGLLDAGTNDEGHPECIAVQHLVQGGGRVGLLVSAALDLGEEALLAFRIGLEAE